VSVRITIFCAYAIVVMLSFGCGGGDVSTVAPPATNTSATISFNMSGALAIAKVDPAAASNFGSSLPFKKMDSSGNLSDFVSTSNGFTISYAMTNVIDPSSKSASGNRGLHLALGQKYKMHPSSEETEREVECMLIKVSITNNSYECIDSSLSSILNLQGNVSNSSIQYDASGGIYYYGSINNGKNVLRKKADSGEITDLISDSVNLYDFLVLDDGTVFIMGSTISTNTSWLRRISSSGAVSNIIGSNAQPTFLSLFPDEKIYYGDWISTYAGVIKVLPTGMIEPQCWIGDDIGHICTGANSVHNVSEVCANAGLSLENYACGINGTFGADIEQLVRINNQVFVISAAPVKKVWKYYPTVEFVSTSIVSTTMMRAYEGKIFIAGLDGNSNNRLISYEINTQVETDLLPGNNIEIYHLNVKADGKIYFDGLNFDTNKYVVGVVDTEASNDLVFLKEDLGSKLEDFQTL